MNLYTAAVPAELLSLLVDFMRVPALSKFYLVGGTALALRFGHRVSVDIDLFTHESFDALKLEALLADRFGLSESTVATNAVTGYIDGIKTDFIAHRYPLVLGVETNESLRVLAVEDIAAMKLNAIANRGSKKDFWDIHELLQHFKRDQLLAF